MGNYLGDFVKGDTVYLTWESNDASGASVTRATDGTIIVYKDHGTSQTLTGVSDTEDFDGLTGIHACNIATTDSWYAVATDFTVAVSGAVIDGQTVNAVLGQFSVENRTQSKNLTAIANISGRLPTSLDNGRMDSNVNAIASNVGAADNLANILVASGVAADVDLSARSLTLENDAGNALSVVAIDSEGANDAIYVSGSLAGMNIRGDRDALQLVKTSSTAGAVVSIDAGGNDAHGVLVSGFSGTSLAAVRIDSNHQGKIALDINGGTNVAGGGINILGEVKIDSPARKGIDIQSAEEALYIKSLSDFSALYLNTNSSTTPTVDIGNPGNSNAVNITAGGDGLHIDVTGTAILASGDYKDIDADELNNLLANLATTSGNVSTLNNVSIGEIVSSGNVNNWDATASINEASIASTVVTSGNAENWNQYSDATAANQTTIINNLSTVSGNISSLNDPSAVEIASAVVTSGNAENWNQYSDATLANQTTIINNLATTSGNISNLPDIDTIVASGDVAGWGVASAQVTVSGLTPGALSEIVASGNAEGWDSASADSAAIASTVVTSGNAAGWDNYDGTIYVSSNGSAGGDGSYDDPLDTVTNAIASASDGNSIGLLTSINEASDIDASSKNLRFFGVGGPKLLTISSQTNYVLKIGDESTIEDMTFGANLSKVVIDGDYCQVKRVTSYGRIVASGNQSQIADSYFYLSSDVYGDRNYIYNSTFINQFEFKGGAAYNRAHNCTFTSHVLFSDTYDMVTNSYIGGDTTGAGANGNIIMNTSQYAKQHELATTSGNISNLNNVSIAEIVSSGNTNNWNQYSDATLANQTTTINNLNTVSGNIDSIASSIDNIASVGSAVNTPAASYVLSSGTQSANTYQSTSALDGVEHTHTDDTGDMDLYYEFNVGGDGVPTSCEIVGRLTGGNDELTVYAYNWNNTTWDIIGNYDGQVSSTNVTRDYILYITHVGEGANIGKVRIRLGNADGVTLTSATLYIDQMFTSYAVVSRTVGYDSGSVWIDTINGTAGTESYVNGVADNPVDSIEDAITIAENVNLKSFRIENGSVIILPEAVDYYSFSGREFHLDLNNKSIEKCYFEGAHVWGSGIGQDTEFRYCHLDHENSGNFKLDGLSYVYNCGLGSGVTISSGLYVLDQCFSMVAGSSAPCLDFNSDGSTEVNVRHYAGGLRVANMGVSGTDIMSLEGHGQLIVGSTCQDGHIEVRGHFDITDEASGRVTINDTANYDKSQIASTVVASGNVENWNQYSDATLSNQTTIINNMATVSGNIDSLNNVSIAEIVASGNANNWDATASINEASIASTVVTSGNAESWNQYSDATLANQTTIINNIATISGNVTNLNDPSAAEIASTVVTSGNAEGWVGSGTVSSIDGAVYVSGFTGAAAADILIVTSGVAILEDCRTNEIRWDFVSTPAKLYIRNDADSADAYSWQLYKADGTSKPADPSEVAVRTDFAIL